MNFTVVNVNTCEPVAGAIVDIWHCDATGLYSHYTSAGAGGSGGMSGTTDATTFLRGIQVSGTQGKVSFASLYPGFYQGRTTHIHVKVRIRDLSAPEITWKESFN
jgi:protocatechuate 3,4-dioxygenase beta subunit